MFGRGFNRHREQVSRGLESRSSGRLGVGARQVTDARRRGRPSAATSCLERNRAFRLVGGCYAAPNRETRVRISATLGPRALTSGIFASTGPWRTLVPWSDHEAIPGGVPGRAASDELLSQSARGGAKRAGATGNAGLDEVGSG